MRYAIGRAAVLAGALILGACAQKVWVKSGASPQDFNADAYACERDTRQSGYFGRGMAASLNMEDFFARCMGAHGWSEQQNADIAPSGARALVSCRLPSGVVMTTEAQTCSVAMKGTY